MAFVSLPSDDGSTPYATIGESGSGSSSDPDETDDQNGINNPCESENNSVGNPINFLTGNKHQVVQDYIGGGRLPLRITRTWNSNSNKSKAFGYRWSSNALIQLTYNSYTQKLEIEMSDGRVDKFYMSEGHWYRQSGSPALIVQDVYDNWGYYDSGKAYSFRADGKITQISDEYGNKLDYTYLTNGLLHKITRINSASLTFAHNSAGKVTTITNPMGKVYTYQINYGALNKVIYPDGNDKVYGYGIGSRLYSITDENDNVFARWNYDSSGKGNESYHGAIQEKYSIVYGADNSTVTNPLGKQTRYNYSEVAGKKRLTSVEGYEKGTCAAANKSITYDDFGYRDIVTDWIGDKTDYDHNQYGRMTKITKGLGSATEYSKTIDYLNEYTEKPIKISTSYVDKDYEYDEIGRIKQYKITNKGVSSTSGPTKIWDYSYELHPGGLVKKVTIDGPRTDVSDIRSREYDIKGNLVKSTNALGHVTTFTNYDNNGRVKKVIEPNGKVTEFLYHDRGWLLERKVNAGANQRLTVFKYDPAGLLEKITRPDNSVLNFEYDTSQRLVKTTDSNNKKLTYTYDPASNITSQKVHDLVTYLTLVFVPDPVLPGGDSGDCGFGEICGGFGGGFGDLPDDNDPSGTWGVQEVTDEQPVTVSNYQFDALSRLSKMIQGEGQTEEYFYRKDNLLSHEKDGLGYQTTYSYNALKLLEWSKDANNKYTRYYYDNENRLERVRDPNGVDTHYDRDGFGQVKKLRSPDTGHTTFKYDSAGNLKETTNANGVITAYTYDALNRIKTVNAGGISHSYLYDNYRKGHLYRLIDNSGTHYFYHTNFGELWKRRDIIQGVDHNTYWTYDNEGRVKKITYPDGRIANYGYDNNGNLNFLSTQAGGSDAVRIIIDNAEYRPFGPIKTLSYGNGEHRAYELDKSARVTELASGNHITYSYEFDANNNIESITDVASASQDRSYTYDILERLKTHSGPDGSFVYTFDNNGNRKTQKRNSSTTTNYFTSGTNKLYKSGNTNYILDIAGNTKQIGSRVFTYNGENRLSRVTNGGSVVDYKYNGFGQRVYKTKGSAKSYYLYGQGGQLLYEKDNGVKKTYLYFNSEVVAYIKNNVVYYVHSDHLGRPQVMTNSSKTKVWQARNDAYNRTVTLGSSLGFNVGFPGQYWDVDTNLFYNYFRDYDPVIGRYVQSDPIGLLGGLNTYAYVINNPTKYVDIFGLDVLDLSINVKIPTFPGSPSISGSDGIKGRGFSLGVAISYPGSLGGEFDMGLIGSVSAGGEMGVGTGKITGSFTCSSGSLKDQDGAGTEASFNDGIGGMAIGFNDNGTPDSVSIHIGPGIELASEGVVTGTLSLRGALRSLDRAVTSLYYFEYL